MRGAKFMILPRNKLPQNYDEFFLSSQALLWHVKTAKLRSASAATDFIQKELQIKDNSGTVFLISL